MEKKYLSDGRKVAVVGKLNNQETIVQEIFVTANGSEIPSGENFVVKSLHNEPVLSYVEKRAKEMEKFVKSLEADRKKIEHDNKKARQELEAIRDIVRSSNKLAQLLPESELDVFSSFITGTIKYLVVDGYTITPPVEMIDKVICWDTYYGDSKYNGIKLVSVLGKSGGDMEYRIHKYPGGSAHTDAVYPFTNKEGALSHIKQIAEEKIDDDRLTTDSYNACIEMGIVFSKKHKERYLQFRNKILEENIKNAKQKLLECQNKLDNLLKGNTNDKK